MFMVEDGRNIDTTVTVAFEDRGGRTLLTIVQTGFERREDRDGIEGGSPSILDALERVVAGRIANRARSEPGRGRS
jgi:uncharacterized protein YndB with AHSA1/START domain